MLVILRENVENLGKIGDVVKVSDGYARNFLLPRRLVSAADENNIAQVENHKRQLAKKRAALVTEAQELAKRLSGVVVSVARKVGEGDKLFGSVSATDIAAGLETQGFKIKKSAIHLDSPIRALGTFTASVKLDTEVSAEVKVTVTKE